MAVVTPNKLDVAVRGEAIGIMYGKVSNLTLDVANMGEALILMSSPTVGAGSGAVNRLLMKLG